MECKLLTISFINFVIKHLQIPYFTLHCLHSERYQGYLNSWIHPCIHSTNITAFSLWAKHWEKQWTGTGMYGKCPGSPTILPYRRRQWWLQLSSAPSYNSHHSWMGGLSLYLSDSQPGHTPESLLKSLWSHSTIHPPEEWEAHIDEKKWPRKWSSWAVEFTITACALGHRSGWCSLVATP